MATCKECGDEVDALVSVKIAGKTKKLCEDCADRAREQQRHEPVRRDLDRPEEALGPRDARHAEHAGGQ